MLYCQAVKFTQKLYHLQVIFADFCNFNWYLSHFIDNFYNIFRSSKSGPCLSVTLPFDTEKHSFSDGTLIHNSVPKVQRPTTNSILIYILINWSLYKMKEISGIELWTYLTVTHVYRRLQSKKVLTWMLQLRSL